MMPRVVAVKLHGKLTGKASVMDLALSLTNKLRFLGITGSIVEFVGEGVKYLSVFDRATIANMSPEIGVLMNYFPIDEITLAFLKDRGDSQKQVDMVHKYYLEQGMFYHNHKNIAYDYSVEFDVSQVTPCIAGPNQPFEKINLNDVGVNIADFVCKKQNEEVGSKQPINDGDILIAAITSCLATSNPFLMVEAGLLAKKAIEKGLRPKKHIKTSFAPGSIMVSEYLQALGLQQYLDKLGFNIVGYGCAVCDGNCGEMEAMYEKTLQESNVVATAVLSGNRNFSGRIHPLIKNNFLMSPALVIAFSLIGSTKVDICNVPLGFDIHNLPVFLRDIWPTKEEIENLVSKINWRKMFPISAAQLNRENKLWESLEISDYSSYCWDNKSTYIAASPFFDDTNDAKVGVFPEIRNARALLLLGNDVTTDHISPVGKIMPFTVAGKYLQEQGVKEKDFNSFGSRRGNHQVMVRGAFSNLAMRNFMVSNEDRGKTKHHASEEILPIYSVAMKYLEEKVPLLIFAGNRYGAGSSRDWAAKATKLLGVKAVIAKSFERIHRSNLICVGVLPLQFAESYDWQSLNLTGAEKFSITNFGNKGGFNMELVMDIEYANNSIKHIPLLLALTDVELAYINSGGVLPYIRNFF